MNLKSILTKNKLINASLLYTIGSFFIRGINFFTVPIFTHLLTPLDYGVTNIYATWSGIFSIFIGMGINGTIGTAKANLNENEFKEYLSSTMFLSTIIFGVSLILSILLKSELSKTLGLNSNVVIVLVINSFFNFVINFISSKYTFDQEPIKYLKVSFVLTFFNILLSIILVDLMISNKYLGRIYGGAIVTTIIGIILYFKIIMEGKILISKKYWGFCLPIAIPIIFHNLSHLVLNQADRIMLQKFTDDVSVGIYSFTYNIGVILNIINMSINSAWVAWYFDSLKNKSYKDIKEKAKIYIVIFTILTIMFLLGSQEFIKILSPIEYWDGIKLLPLIILGYYFVFLYTFGVNYEFYKNKTIFIATGTIMAAIVNIGVNFILIPKIGMSGAAISTLSAYFILFIMHEFIVRVIFKHKDFPFIYYIYSIISIIVGTIITYILSNNFIIRWIIIIVIFIISVVAVIKLYKNKKV